MPVSISRTRQGLYQTRRAVSREELLGFAQGLVAERFSRGSTLASPAETKGLLAVEFALDEREVFAAVFLDNQHRVLAFERLFFGTLSSASVHPREVVKRCLALNAAAIIVAHNHPSGHPDPSQADFKITERLVSALAMIEVSVLDHFVVGGADCVSFSEKGWI